MKKIRLFSILSFVVIASLSLASCTTATPTTAPAAPTTASAVDQPTKEITAPTEVPATSGEVVELTYLMQQDAKLVPAMQAVVDDFMAAYPNIKVTIDSAPFSEYHTKLSTSFAGGNPPDVFWTDIRTAQYASQGVLMPLDDRITQENRDDYLASAWNETIYEGVTYAVPLHQLTEGIFVNTQMAADAGIELPTNVENAWTWEEFMNVAETLTKREGDSTTVWGFSQQRPLQDWSMLPLFYQNDAVTLSPDLTKASGYINSEAGIEAMTFMSSWYNTAKIISVESIPDGFPNGSLAMMQAPSSYRPLLETNFPDFKFTIVPMFKNKSCGVTTGGWNMGIAAASKHPEEAWLLVDYVTRIAHEKWVTTSGYLPARKSVIEGNPQFAEYPWVVFMEQLQKCAVTRPATPKYNFYFDTFKQMVVDISVGEDVTTVVNRTAEALDAELGQ